MGYGQKMDFMQEIFCFIDEAETKFYGHPRYSSEKIPFIIAVKIEDICSQLSTEEDSELLETIKLNFWDWFEVTWDNSIVPNEKLDIYKKAKDKIKDAQYKNDTYAYNLTDNGTISIRGYLGKSTENLVIPEAIEGLTVTEIYNMRSPSLNVSIMSITIPKTVESIEEFAFSYYGIETLKFDKNTVCKKIGYGAFQHNKIKNYEIPASIKEIHPYAFSNNEIEEINIPRKEIKIAAFAFTNNKIKKISLYKDWAIYTELAGLINYCGFITNSDYLEEVIYEDGCTYIATAAFQNCKNLKKISLPSSMKQIRQGAFRNCSSLTDIDLRGSVKLDETFQSWTKAYLDNASFYGCPLSIQSKSKLLQAGLTQAAFESKMIGIE